MEKHSKGQASIHSKQSKDIREAISYPKTIAIFVRFSGKRKRDIDGCVASILDEMVTAGCLEDDAIQKIDCVLSFGIPVEKNQEGFDAVII